MAETDPLQQAVPFIDKLSEDARIIVTEGVRKVSVEGGKGILQPGDRVDGAYFVRKGSIRVFYLDEEGREGTLYTIGRGQSCVLALNCLFAEMEYPAWAEAGEQGAEIYHLNGKAARRLMSQDPAFLSAIFAQVSSRLYGLLATLEQAIRLPLKGRLVALLLRMGQEDQVIRISQQKIAAHLGTSREVVSRMLKGLVSEGLVSAGYGRVRVLDRAALADKIG